MARTMWMSGLVIGILAASAHAQTITTVAGGYGSANVGDGGLATAATIGSLGRVALDAAGNLYFAEQAYHRVRKVDAASGTISTVAGTGVCGLSGDGGAASAAQLCTPVDLAVEASGNLLVAEATYGVVRRIDMSTGVITRVAGTGTRGGSGDGGAATSAQFRPLGIAVDGSGNILVADVGNHRVRRIHAASGVVTTIAGTGTPGNAGDGAAATAAEISEPQDVAVDGSGNIFIAEGNRVRRIGAGSGIITTVAGTGTEGFSGDGGPATAAGLNGAAGIALDSTGALFIAESAPEGRIRKVAPGTNVITTIAGNGAATLAGDGGPATAASMQSLRGVRLDAAGNLYVSDTGNGRVRRIDAATNVITSVAGGGVGDGRPAADAAVYTPISVVADAAGNFFVTDRHRIRKVAANGVISTYAGDGVAGSTGDGGPASAARVNNVHGMAVNAAGDLYFAEQGGSRVRMISAGTGVITTVAGSGVACGALGDGGPATSASLCLPYGVAVAANGDIYIADTSNDRIRRVNAATGVITTVAGTTPSFSGDGGAATSAQLSFPMGVAVDAAGNLLVSDSLNNRIRRIDLATGIISTIAGVGVRGDTGDGGPATAAQVRSVGLAVDGEGNIFFAQNSHNRIRKIAAATGVITTVAGNGVMGYSGDGAAPTSARWADPGAWPSTPAATC